MQSKSQISIIDLMKSTKNICSSFIDANESLPCVLIKTRETNCSFCPLGNMPLFKSMYGEYINEPI